MNRDNPNRKPFHRHHTDFDLRDTSDHLTDRVSADDGRQKVRVSAGSNHIGEQVRIPTGVPTVTDTMQNTRMDEIERAIRSLTDDMARNRSTFSALIEELRGDGNHLPWPSRSNGHAKDLNDDDANEIAYLIGRMERNVEAKFKELARAWSVLGDRLREIETVVEDFDVGDGRPFAKDRFEKFEVLLTSLPQRLSEMERRLQQAMDKSDFAFDDNRLIAKLAHVEKLIQDSPNGNFELAPVIAGLRDVEAGLRGLGGQVREVDSRAGDLNLAIDGIGDRQKRMEDLIEAQQALVIDLKQEIREEIGNGFVGRPDGTDTISTSVGAAVSERFAGMSSQLNGRMDQLEDLVRAALDRPPMVVDGSGEVDNGFMTDAMTKVINNQHTLAGSIDDWRAQSRDEMAAIAARMDRFENKPFAGPELPHERFNEISERLEHIQSNMHRRQELDGWTRFKMWLYGTSDWYDASWSSGSRGNDRGWAGNRNRNSNETLPDGSVDTNVYDRNAYDNQRV